MSKRRRTSSTAGRNVDEEANESDSQSTGLLEFGRKKKKLDPIESLQTLYDTLRNCKKDDGSLLCDAFIRAPKRRQEPGYYEVVSNPIDMLRVQQKLKTEEYEDIEDFQADIELLINNAKSFYKKSSQEYKDANELWELYQQTKARLFETCDETTSDNKAKIILKVGKLSRRSTPSTPEIKKQESVDIEESSTESWATTTDDELNFCEDLFSSVITATDQDSRPLHFAFQLLPSKKKYPEYYTVIENPIDLRSIARKIQDGKYNALNEMEKDLLQMTKNACIFNEPGSQIYKDAKSLKRVITSRKIEIEHGRGVIEKKSERIRNKRLRGTAQSLSAITAALKSESEDSSDGEEDVNEENMEFDGDPDNPRWILYRCVRMYKNSHGVPISSSFLKLPSKRYFPNYYKEIKNAVSFLMIKRKLSNGDYGTVSELAGDMNILFENAKKFNKPDTKLYRDALRLQRVMQNKVQELLDLQHQYSDSDDSSSDEPPTKRVKSRVGSRIKSYQNNLPLRRKLNALCKCLMDFTFEDGRQPLLSFMEKPSKKIYPDYYKVITEPIDMITIDSNIRNEKYNTEEELLNDFKLMFRNCREYNEEGSLIYEDSLRLEKVLQDRYSTLNDRRTPIKNSIRVHSPSPVGMKQKRIPLPPPTPTMIKMRTLFNTIKDYKDPKGRLLSVIFNKLPSKIEYPDYYEVIKRPINLEIISQKLRGNCYDSLDELVSDFILMFDNACKYNEPDSQIYKDALVLQRVTLQTKLQLREDEDTVPDVPAAVQELLTTLFTCVYNHQDEEGRCFSDSMAELPEHDEVEGKKARALSLDLIKRRLDSGQYRRLDMFQDDMFTCLERARQLSRTDSQVFEDSIELQSFFIRQRDELCRNGDLLHSPALNYSLLDLSAAVNEVRDMKQGEEQLDTQLQEEDPELKVAIDGIKEETSAIEAEDSTAALTSDNAMSHNQQIYRIGDFVYAEPSERGMESIILNIQRLWINQDNQQMVYGNQYYRPTETYHVTTRKFLEKEVFKTEQHIALPLTQVKGRCAVLNVKDYFKYKPEAFDEKDVYVCESRYSTKGRCFKKIKVWPVSLTGVCKLIEREEPLEPKRNVSVYRDRVEKHKEEIAELEEQEKLLVKEKPNVEALHLQPNADETCTYYEQYNAHNCIIKTGDCVYLKNENKNTSRTLICQIDKIWTNNTGEVLIHGPWLVLPSDMPHPPNRLFYKQEIFLSTLENTNQVTQIIGKCAVLEHSEYISCRPTEIPESEVYICESMFDEARQQIIELPRDGLKKYIHSVAVYQDEIYFFRRLINPTKVNAVGEPEPVQPPPEKPLPFSHCDTIPQNTGGSSLLTPKIEPPDINTEDSCDGGPPSVCSSDIGAPSTPTNLLTYGSSTQSTRKRRSRNMEGSANKSKQVTGYILYSSEIRRTVSHNNPQRSFGEVSRIVGNEWKRLPAAEKNAWEEKAQRINEETQLKIERGELNVAPLSSFHNAFIGPHLPDHVWECLWDNCDWLFEEQADCFEHTVADTGHVASFFAGTPSTEAEYQCHWKACPRLKKQAPPFPNLARLIRHVKEVHILKNPGRVAPLAERGKNVVPSYRQPPPPPTPPPTIVSQMPPSPCSSETSNAASSSTPVNNSQPSRTTMSPHPQNVPAVVSSTANGTTTSTQTVEPEPLFITVPPRPTKVFHSDIYLKYIEGLKPDNRQVSNWQSEFNPPRDSIVVDESRLPGHWLANGAANHASISDALWALRNHMLRDTLNISRIL